MLTRLETKAELRRHLRRAFHAGRSIGFVPTMGALHRGHAALIARARDECDQVVVSIFVNPLQFDRPEDLARYPRTLDADAELCASLRVDDLFVPGAAEMYPVPPLCRIEMGTLADHLCGRFRPGHFSGMALVVAKLLQIVGPDVAYFGDKDAQQLAIVRRMVQDFDMPVRIAGVPTVRESDGLAMSSRNARLNPEERQLAPGLFAALRTACAHIEHGGRLAEDVIARASASLPRSSHVRLEYLEIVDPDDLQPVTRIDGSVLVAAAMWVGQTRLIDNIRCTPPKQP